MTRITFVGDPHGDTGFTSLACRQAEWDNADLVCLLGDNSLDSYFYNILAEDAKNWNVDIVCNPGNHDHWGYLDESLVNLKMHVRPWGMFEGVELHPRVFYIPPATITQIGGKRVLFVGGADSIDKDWRIQEDVFHHIRGHHLWWPQEMINEDEVEKACSFGKVDILVTHDSSEYKKFEFAQKNYPASDRNRERVTRIVKATRPGVHVHGHWHYFYQETIALPFDNGGELDWWEYQMTGLNCNGYQNLTPDRIWTYDTDTGWTVPVDKLNNKFTV